MINELACFEMFLKWVNLLNPNILKDAFIFIL